MNHTDTDRINFLESIATSFEFNEVEGNIPRRVELFNCTIQHQYAHSVRGAIDLAIDIGKGKKAGCINGEYGN